MKVIKVVGEGDERRTYVEGGPACDNWYSTCMFDEKGKHVGDERWGCTEGEYIKSAGDERDNYTVRRDGKDVCPKCHGTGLQAVELWPDKVKADWLKKNAPHVVRGDKHCPDELEISVIVGEYEFEWEVYYRDGLDIDDKRWLMASDKDFAIALTKAVIKRSEELCG